MKTIYIGKVELILVRATQLFYTADRYQNHRGRRRGRNDSLRHHNYCILIYNQPLMQLLYHNNTMLSADIINVSLSC